MSFLRVLRRPTLRCTSSPSPFRGYAAKPAKKESQPKIETVQSSCSANTLMPGLNYLKGQPPVMALPDEEYPSWLWTLLQPKVEKDAGPESLIEKRKMRTERKSNLKYSNFMKTQ